jgi:hypothetical protein
MTAYQLKVLEFVRERIARTAISPTIREIREACGGGLAGVQSAISSLIEQGQLTRIPLRKRGLGLAKVIDLRAASTAAMHAELARRGDAVPVFPQQERLAFGHAVSCALDSCRTEVGAGQWFCRDHWSAVDPTIQQSLLRAHAAYRRSQSRENQADYQAAFSEAREQAARRYPRAG